MKLFELFGEIRVDDNGSTEQIENTDKKASNLGTTLGKVGKGTVAAGKAIGVGMVAVAGGVSLVTAKISENTDRIDKMSQNLGFSAEGFQEWDFILSQSGASIDSLETGMATLSKQVTDGAEGSAAAAEAFAKLNLDVGELAGLTQEEIFEKTIAGLQNMEEGAERTALASELLGKSGKEMGALLNSSSKDIDDMKKSANDLGLVLGGDTVAAGVAMTDSIDQMKRTLVATLTTAFAPLIPVVMELMESFVEILPTIVEFIAPLAEKLIPVVGEIIEKLLPVFIKLLDALMPVIEPLLDILIVLVDAGLIPLIEAITPLIIELIPPLTVLLGYLADALNLLLPIITFLVELISDGLQEALKGAEIQFDMFMTVVETVADFVKDVFIDPIIDGIDNVIGMVDKAVQAFKDLTDIDLPSVSDIKFPKFKLPSFDVGSDYVPYDMVAQIHEGERILTKEENMNGTQGNNVSVNVYGTIQDGTDLVEKVNRGLYDAKLAGDFS